MLAACKRNDGMPDGQMAEMNETVGQAQVTQDKREPRVSERRDAVRRAPRKAD